MHECHKKQNHSDSKKRQISLLVVDKAVATPSMKSCITTLLKENSEGISSKDLRKQAVKGYLSENSQTEMQPKRKQEAKAQFDKELKKLTEKGKIETTNDIVRLIDSKEKKEKKDKKDKKEKKDKKRKREEEEEDAVVKEEDEPASKKSKEKTIVSNPTAAPETTETVEPPLETTEKSEEKKEKAKKKKVKTEKIGFNVVALPKKDPEINPLTGKKLKKRSKEAYERRKARFLMVKNLDSRNKRAQAEFDANKRWMNSGSGTGTAVAIPSSSSTTTTTPEPVPLYFRF